MPTGYTPHEHRTGLNRLRTDLGYVDPCEAECPRCHTEHDPLDRCPPESAEDRDCRLTHARFDREASQ